MSGSFKQLGAVQSHRLEGSTLSLAFGGPVLAITTLTDQIMRVRLAPTGSFAPRRSWAVAAPDEEFPGAAAQVAHEGGVITLRTAALAAHVDTATGALRFTTADGRAFCADEVGAEWQDGGGQVRCAKQIAAGEHFYGFGERTGQLDKRGQLLSNWTTDQYRYGPCTDPLYIAIPTFMALRPGLAYGVFFNNTWRSSFDVGAARAGALQIWAEGGELDYYVVYGPRPEAVSQGLAQILGTMPLPPRWALGYHQSRWSYGSDAETRQLAEQFRSRQIPLDAIHLDIDYMRGYRDFTWNDEAFPDPAALVADLRRAGVRVVPIIDAGVKADPEYGVFIDGSERDMFLRRADGEVFHGYVWPDDSVFADFLRPEVRAWWGQQQRPLAELGIGGIWNDMNEPTVFDLPFSQGGGLPHTIDLDAPQGPAGEQTTHAEVHNLYGSNMAQASYQGMRMVSDERPFVLTRSGFAGVQRWSACWMGDNCSRWEHMEMTMPQLMNMGLSGVPFVGTDIGGFYDNATGELFARWMQLGALVPFARGHSTAGTARHEPWAFGPEVEAICREYLALRYRLMPYLYSLFWEASQRGTPVMRPLLYHFPDDTATYGIHDQFMLGPWLLAAPVYHADQRCRHVYLPEGTWHDWWTGEVTSGPAHILAQAPLERMPLYVRGGAIVASGPASLHAHEGPLAALTLDIYPGDGEWTHYDDDGISFAYERGECSTTRYRVGRTPQGLRFEAQPRQGSYRVPPRPLTLRFHGAAAQGGGYDAATQVLTVERRDDGQPFQLDIALA
ncbi:DUF5110 domain-containing protein [Chloroflexia bacterium SDU3-3]|nr:DUF5110 domain-containing protein [Chloroflexia bacterium SDU3-3]